MSLLYQKHASRPLTLDNRVEPELYRDVFPYTHPRVLELLVSVTTDCRFRDSFWMVADSVVGIAAKFRQSCQQIAVVF